MLHLSPRVGDLEHNRQSLLQAVVTASNLGANWVITPELCLSGYQFAPRLGTEWIVPQPDAWMETFRTVVAALGLTVFLSHAERDAQTDKLHNSVFVIAPDGSLIGRHRKVRVVPMAEDWASAGDRTVPVFVPPVSVGILVCADAYTPQQAQSLKAGGATLLVAPSAWPPEPHGPGAVWEARSRETGLPMLVCNRTGTEDSLCFDDAESAMVKEGRRLCSFSGPHATLLAIDWDLKANGPVQKDFHKVRLDGMAGLATDFGTPGNRRDGLQVTGLVPVGEQRSEVAP